MNVRNNINVRYIFIFRNKSIVRANIFHIVYGKRKIITARKATIWHLVDAWFSLSDNKMILIKMNSGL